MIQESEGSDWIVTAGVEAGQKLIVSGFQRLRAGTPVQDSSVSGRNLASMKVAPSSVTPE